MVGCRYQQRFVLSTFEYQEKLVRYGGRVPPIGLRLEQGTDSRRGGRSTKLHGWMEVQLVRSDDRGLTCLLLSLTSPPFEDERWLNVKLGKQIGCCQVGTQRSALEIGGSGFFFFFFFFFFERQYTMVCSKDLPMAICYTRLKIATSWCTYCSCSSTILTLPSG